MPPNGPPSEPQPGNVPPGSPIGDPPIPHPRRGGPPVPPRPPDPQAGDGDGNGGPGLVIGLAVVVVLVAALGAVAAFMFASSRGDAGAATDAASDLGAESHGTSTPAEQATPSTETLPTTGPDTPPPGVDDELDDLWLACADEDWAACDDLFIRSDIDSDYEFFGTTCGYRTLDAIFCETEFGDPETSPPSASPDAAPAPPPGQDAALDGLWSACQGQDWVACDRLYFESEPGSDYEFFGATCGNRDIEGGGDLCQNVHAADGALPVVLPDGLAPGMCFDEPAEEEVVFWVPTVPCDQPHDVEVMGLVELSESSFPTDMSAVAFERCEPIFADFVGLAYPESVLDIYHLSPTQESWSLGDRGIACGIYDPAGPVDGSLEGAAR